MGDPTIRPNPHSYRARAANDGQQPILATSSRAAPSPSREVIGLKRLMEEIMATHTGQPIEKVQKDMDRDFYMTSQQAQAYGIIDAVVSSRDSTRAVAAAY
jgi:hypothetical protein